MNLPIEQVLPELLEVLQASNQALLHAEPGAGKTTRVPLALLDSAWLQGKKILLLEPRRVAAIGAAEFMSEQRGEPPGQTIGYRTRTAYKISSSTKLEVATEGILTRLLLDDPSLADYGAIIFDEFHERSVHSDLGLAFCLESQSALRPDLRLLVMSATLEIERFKRLMPQASTLHCPGRTYPVEIRYTPPSPQLRFEEAIVDLILNAVRETIGDILAFLPGAAEIRRAAERLEVRANVLGLEVLMLMGELSLEEQRRVLKRQPSAKRRVILATNIAETSVTIDGIRVVVDGGLMRVSRADHARGMSALQTVSVSQASATQRAGRAGRQQPGICYRMWSEGEQRALQPFHTPEILSIELSAPLLQISGWGCSDLSTLSLLDLPQKTAIEEGFETLIAVGAVDSERRLTSHGKELLALGIHPRIAHMLVLAKHRALGPEACLLAAILEEQSLVRARGAELDLSSRFVPIAENSGRDSSSKALFERVRSSANRLMQRLGVRGQPDLHAPLGLLLGYAYPERIAQSRNLGGSTYLMANGIGAKLPEGSALAKHQYLAVASLEGKGANARILLAEPIAEAEVREIANGSITEREVVEWNRAAETVRGISEERLGALRLAERSFRPSDEQCAPLVLSRICELELRPLSWTQESESFVERVTWLRNWLASDSGAGVSPFERPLPDLSRSALVSTASSWLAPFMLGVRSLKDAEKVPTLLALEALFSPRDLKTIRDWVPAFIDLPTGTKAWISYQGIPTISVKLQELFGFASTPKLVGGKVSLATQLLSPAKRPLQVTSDLASFWRTIYPKLRGEMRARYPKHEWPEDPTSAAPSKGPKARRPRHS